MFTQSASKTSNNKVLFIGALFMFLFFNKSFGQGVYIGPDDTTCLGSQYTVYANFNNIPGAGASSSDGLQNIDDHYSAVINIGFPFTFFGNTYTQCLLSTNAYITFDLTNATGFSPFSINNAIPSTANPMNSIMGAWMDLFPGAGGNGLMSYGTFGTAPNRYFVYNLCSMPYFVCTTQQFKGQIVLYETTNVIEIYIYQHPGCSTWNSGAAIEGIQNATGTIAYWTPGRNFPTVWTTNLDGYKFTPTGTTTYTGSVIPFAPKLAPVVVNWFTNGVFYGTGTSITLNVNSTTTVTAQIQGCDTTLTAGNFNFYDTMVLYVAPPINFTTTVHTPSCLGGGNNGSIILNSNNAYGPFTNNYYDASHNLIATHNIPTITTMYDSLPNVGTSIYYVNFANRFGCIDSATINVTSNAPVFFITGNDSICLNQNTTLSTTGLPPTCGLSSINCPSPTSHNVGAFSPTTVGPFPSFFPGANPKGKVQMIFTAAELITAGLSAAGPISELAVNVVTKNSTLPYENLYISMGCVPTTLTAYSTANWYNATALTTVFSAASISTTLGINNFVFPIPYDWDGVSNLVVEVCFANNGGTWSGGNDFISKTNIGVNRTLYNIASIGVGCASLLSPTLSLNRPDIRFRHCSGSIPGTATYQWTIPPSATVLYSTPSITVSPTVTTTYQCIVNDNGCTNTKTFTVNQLTVNSIHMPDTAVCTNGSIVLHPVITGPVPPYPLACGTNNTVCNSPVLNIVGSGNDNTSMPSITTSNTDGRVFFIYTKNDLIAGGVTVASTIKNLAFNILQKNTTGSFSNFTIKMGCMPLGTSLPADFYASGTLATVYGPSTFNPVVGWNNFTLTNSYDWNGNTDLVIEICYNNVILGAGGVNDIYEKTLTATNTAMYAYMNSVTANGCALSYVTSPTVAITNLRPNCRFGVCPANTSSYNYTFNVLSGPGVIVQGCPNDIFSTTGTTTIEVKLQGTAPCIVADTFTISSNPNSSITLGADTTYCSNTPINRTLGIIGNPGNATWQTLNGSTLSCTFCSNPVITVNPGVSDTIIAMYSYAAGCNVTDTLVITVNPVPTPTFSLSTPICSSSSTTITYTGTASAAATYNWYWGAGTPAPTNAQGPHNVTFSTTTTVGVWESITLSVTENGCTSAAGIDSVFVIPTPNADFKISSSSTINYGTNPTMANACWGDSAHIVFLGSVSNLAIAGTPTFNWNFAGGTIQNGANANSAGPFDIKWNTPGLKMVTLTITQGTCSSLPKADSVLLNPNLTSNFTLNPHPAICAGSSFSAQYAGNNISGLNYNWSLSGTPANITSGQNTTTAQVSCNNSGVVNIQLQTSLNGCNSLVGLDSTIVRPLPVASFTSTNTNTCSNVPVTVNFNGTTNPNGSAPVYSWNFAGGTASPGGNNSGPHTITWTNNNTSATTPSVSLTITQDGCTSNTFTTIINVFPYPVAALSTNNASACSGTPITVSTANSQINTTNGGTVNYNWSFSTNPGGALPGAGPQNFTWTNNSSCAINESVSLSITQDGCTSLNTAQLPVIIKAIPVASFTALPSPVCIGTNPVLQFNGVTCTSGGIVSFAWNFDGGAATTPNTNIPGPLSVVWSNTSNSTATYNPSLIVTQDGCSSSAAVVPVSIYANPNVTITGPNNFCDGEIITLDAGSGYINYLWTTGASNQTISVSNAAAYSVNIVDANGCKGSASKTVYSNPIPVANAGPDALIFAGNAAMLNGTGSFGGDSYWWTPAVGIDNQQSAIPYATPDKNTNYILTYSNSLSGCSSTDTVTVLVRECQQIFIPNAFTPNEDGIDDYFMLSNPDAFYRLTRFEIYNRWGTLMYSTNDKNAKGWDGKYLGKDQDAGTYIYSIIAECGGKQTVLLKGDVALIR